MFFGAFSFRLRRGVRSRRRVLRGVDFGLVVNFDFYVCCGIGDDFYCIFYFDVV